MDLCIHIRNRQRAAGCHWLIADIAFAYIPLDVSRYFGRVVTRDHAQREGIRLPVVSAIIWRNGDVNRRGIILVRSESQQVDIQICLQILRAPRQGHAGGPGPRNFHTLNRGRQRIFINAPTIYRNCDRHIIPIGVSNLIIPETNGVPKIFGNVAIWNVATQFGGRIRCAKQADARHCSWPLITRAYPRKCEGQQPITNFAYLRVASRPHHLFCNIKLPRHFFPCGVKYLSTCCKALWRLVCPGDDKPASAERCRIYRNLIAGRDCIHQEFRTLLDPRAIKHLGFDGARIAILSLIPGLPDHHESAICQRGDCGVHLIAVGFGIYPERWRHNIPVGITNLRQNGRSITIERLIVIMPGGHKPTSFQGGDIYRALVVIKPCVQLKGVALHCKIVIHDDRDGCPIIFVHVRLLRPRNDSPAVFKGDGLRLCLGSG